MDAIFAPGETRTGDHAHGNADPRQTKALPGSDTGTGPKGGASASNRQGDYIAPDDTADTLRIAFVRHKSAPVHAVDALTWPALVARLAEPQRGPKDGLGWLPAVIEPGPRTGERVEAVTALVLDVEAKTSKDQETGVKTVIGPEPPTPADCAAEVALWGWEGCIHTSHAHLYPAILPADQVHPRYRLVLRLTRALTGTEVRPLGLHVLALLGMVPCADVGCLEPARFFYLPRCPSERLSLFEHHVIDGEPLAVDALLDAARREAEAVQSAAKHRPAPRTGNVIQAFNAAHDLAAMLAQHGYPVFDYSRPFFA